MDIGDILADRALLTSLSREYELLKATNADVDWQQWITARLQRAAASRVSVETPNHAAGSHYKQQGVQQGRQQAVSLRTPSLNRAPARSQPGRFTSSSRRSSAADASIREGAAQDRTPTWQAQDVTNTCASESKQQHPGIILRVNSGNAQQHQAGTQPHWVAAAKLGNALQASRVVPVLHAAADRERRLAAVTAVARQQLGLGVSEASVLAAAASREQQLQPAAQEQLQQVVKWTQEVAQQNQLLQKAMLQQQEQLTHHQGLLTTVLQQAHKEEANTHGEQPAHQVAPAAAAGPAPPAPAAGPQPARSAVRQLSAAGNDASPRRTAGPGHLLDQVKDSWLVKAVLQQDCTRNDNSAGAAAGPSAPDFIRIAGASKQPTKQKHAQDQHSNPSQLQPQQKGDVARALGAAEGGDAAAAAAAERRRQLKGVLRQLLSRGAVGPLSDGLSGLVAGLKGLQDSSTHQQQKEQQSQDTHKETAASLVALLQQQQQQQQQRTQLSKAQLLVLQRRQAQQEQRRQQQQQEEADSNAQDDSGRPGWQSDVYVPPPARMLRVKKAGAADVWNAPPSSKTGAPRMTGRSRGSKPTAPQRKPAQHRAAGARGVAPARRVSTGGPAGRPRVSSAGGWRVDGGLRQPQQQQQQQWCSSNPLGVDNRDSSEHRRLARVEETAAQVLKAVARLEQRVQHQQQPQQQEQQQEQPPVTGPPGNTAAGPTSLQIDPSALSNLLAALDRVEQQEQEIRDRWFGSGDDGGSSGTADGSKGDAQASAVVDTDNQSGQNELIAAADVAAPADLVTAQESSSAATADSKLWQQSQPLDGHLQEACPVPEVLQPLQPCALSEAALKSIKAGRQRMLRHQALLDGTVQDRGHSRGGGRWVVGSSSRSSSGRAVLQPNQVVEAVSDMLLDELLLDEAEGLDGLCDALCNQLIEDEFEEA